MNSYNWDELADLSDLEDLGLYEDMDLDDLGLDDLISIDDIQGEEEEFDGKFFISYLGLNPVTLVKEELDVIKMMVRQNMDHSRLIFLIDNLKRFKDHANKKLNDLDDTDQMNIGIDMISKLNQSISLLEDLASYEVLDIMSLNFNKRYKTEPAEFVSTNADLKDFLDDLIRSNVDTKMTELKMSALRNIVDSLHNLNAIILEGKTENMPKKFNEYKTRAYQYSEEEIEVMRKLDFPMSIVGHEPILKLDLMLSNTYSNLNVDNFYVRQIYSVLTNTVIMDGKKKDLIKYYV